MFRDDESVQFASPDELLQTKEYTLAPDDEISLMVFPNHGERIFDPVSTNASSSNQINSSQSIKYKIQVDGTILLPVIGSVKLDGLTIEQAEKLLVEEYSTLIRDPFVKVGLLNKRIIVFPGGQGSQAVVLPLENLNTTLIEALASAGGINEGKASRIKLIRTINGQTKVYKIDLSHLSGLTYASIVLQANDVVYVEPRKRTVRRVLEELTPYLSFISTAMLIYTITR